MIITKIYFLPQTKFGRLALVFLLSFLLFIILFYSILAIFDVRGGDTFFSNPELAIPILLAWVSGLLAFIASLIAIIKEKTKSIIVFVSLIVGFMVTAFGLLEVIFPH